MAVNDIQDREERPAYVRFEKRPIEDTMASREAGQVVYKDIDYVLVTPPYSKDCVEMKWERWIKNVEINVKNGRTPEAWMDHWKKAYEHWKRGEEAPLNGTDIRNWSAITPAQIKTCLAANIRTIEDLAGANDEGLRRLGMGGIDMKNKATAYVKAAKDTGPLVMENAALKKQLQIQEGTIASLSEKLEIVSARLEAMQGQPLVEIPKVDHSAITAADIMPDEPSLEEQYIEKFGKKPHHKMKPETIKAKLEE